MKLDFYANVLGAVCNLMLDELSVQKAAVSVLKADFLFE